MRSSGLPQSPGRRRKVHDPLHPQPPLRQGMLFTFPQAPEYLRDMPGRWGSWIIPDTDAKTKAAPRLTRLLEGVCSEHLGNDK